MLPVYLLCIFSWLGTPQACMPSMRLTSYIPSVYWWQSNVTALNETQARRQNPKPQRQESNSSSVETTLTTLTSTLTTTSAPLIPQLLPIQPSVDTHRRTAYYRIVGNPEIPMPKPAFVAPYYPPPALRPPVTENPSILWNKVLASKPQINTPSKSHEPNNKWWVSVAVNATQRPHSTATEGKPMFVDVPFVTNPDDVVSVSTVDLPPPGRAEGEVPTTEDDLISESSEVRNKLQPTELPDPTSVLSTNTIDVSKDVNLTNVRLVEVTTRRDTIETQTLAGDVAGTAAVEGSATDGMSQTDGFPAQQSSTESASTEKIELGGSTLYAAVLSPSTAIVEISPNQSIATSLGERPADPKTLTGDSSNSTESEEPVIESESATSPSRSEKGTKFPRPFNAHEEIITQHSKISDSFIQTMPPNSVILIVEDPNDKEQIMNVLNTTTATSTTTVVPTETSTATTITTTATPSISTTTSTEPPTTTSTEPPTTTSTEPPTTTSTEPPTTTQAESSTVLAEKFNSPRDTPPEDVTNTTERLDVPTTILQISNDTYRLSSDLLNVTQSGADAVTEQMIAGSAAASTDATVAVESSTSESSRPGLGPREGSWVKAPVGSAIAVDTDITANKASTVLDAFRGSIIDVSSTESSKEAIDVSESPSRVRIVNEEDVLLEKIPHSVGVKEASQGREDAMQSDTIISSVMQIINASAESEARRKASDQTVTQGRTRKLSNADISYRIDWQVEPETTWLAEGVLLPNGTSVIVPKEGIRGVPGVLPLPPAPVGIAMQTSKIQMRRQRLIDGKKILVATIPQENPQNPPLVYYYWKEPRTRRYVLVDE
ncbi:mucin-5AC-like [Galendromus occidentalis]|uniref:Mucin-5AC-like n=1 Tax=Galendromus occidentalis TaxID=34638 RepID=A0AAJ7L7U0_9ACAR|nr:mucin-5AC-like [Galendromus occidentalis]